MIANHLFLSCSIARAVWFAFECDVRLDLLQPQSIGFSVEHCINAFYEDGSINSLFTAVVVGSSVVCVVFQEQSCF